MDIRSKPLRKPMGHPKVQSITSLPGIPGSTSRRILRLYDDGWTPDEISLNLNISRQVVILAISNLLKRTA